MNYSTKMFFFKKLQGLLYNKALELNNYVAERGN